MKKAAECKGTAKHDHTNPMTLDLVSKLLFGMTAAQLADDVRRNKDGKYDAMYGE